MIRDNILLCGKFGIVVNFILGSTKIILGFISGSISIMIEAINNIIDMFSSVLLLIGVNKSIDEKNISFVISLFMIIMSCIFVDESIEKVIHPVVLNFNIYFYMILAITFVIKVFQYNVYKSINKNDKVNCINVITIETKNDIINSFSIAVSLIFMGYFNINVDGYIGLLSSLFILKNCIKALKEIK